MTPWLQVDNQLVVGRERVLRELLKICDPKGVALRLKHRLERRRYVNKGPNFTCLALWKHRVNLLLQSFRPVSSDLHQC